MQGSQGATGAPQPGSTWTDVQKGALYFNKYGVRIPLNEVDDFLGRARANALIQPPPAETSPNRLGADLGATGPAMPLSTTPVQPHTSEQRAVGCCLCPASIHPGQRATCQECVELLLEAARTLQ